MNPEMITFYGPARSVRGRLLNLLRRLVGRPERDEVIGSYLASGDGSSMGNTMTVAWTSAGIFTIDDEKPLST